MPSLLSTPDTRVELNMDYNQLLSLGFSSGAQLTESTAKLFFCAPDIFPN
ncbi:predicted protein [Botrytis cinerea T4]|uniref:Uncharacterized protein n=1 Tax=Botryotinia fuckeliana (strain T4) TaxID=999810 RepID=G2YNT3_BOTF4|nr:predicted protein [Botrytis cinerea T4]